MKMQGLICYSAILILVTHAASGIKDCVTLRGMWRHQSIKYAVQHEKRRCRGITESALS